MKHALSLGVMVIAISRVVGIVRELSVAVLIGFTANTDLYYLASFPLFAALAMFAGPFTTAFTAKFGQSQDRDQGPHLRYYRRRLFVLSLLVGIFYAFAAVIASLGGFEARLIIAFCILTPAGTFVILQGYFLAELSAHGRIATAAFVQLVMNILFVAALLAAWRLELSGSAFVLPAILSASLLIAAITSFLFCVKHIGPSRGNNLVSPKPFPGFKKSLSLASSESIAFLGTQALILSLAGVIGTGWISAVSLSQRIAFSVLSLCISPFSTLLMINIMKSGNEKLRTARIGIAIGAAFLTAFGAVMMIVTWKSNWFYPHLAESAEVQLILGVLPAFAIWLLPVGVNTIMSRASFATGRENTYTAVVLTGYVAANCGRVAAFVTTSTMYDIVVVGAVIEGAFLLTLFFWIYRPFGQRRSRDDVQEPKTNSNQGQI